MSGNRKINLILVGRIFPLLGGITVLLQQEINHLKRRHDVSLIVVGISGSITNRVERIREFFATLFSVYHNMLWADVIVVAVRVPVDLCYGLLIIPFAKLLGKKIVIRKFAGNFDVRYEQMSYICKFLYRRILFNADLWLFETKHLVEKFSTEIRAVRWFPNHRPMSELVKKELPDKKECRRFVYVGQVREYKGIRELAEAAKGLPDGVTVDVYGPIFDDLPPDIFDHRRRIFYKGFLNHRDVVATMQQYDAFVLPTKALSEGYPGVILEAYMAGLPVIASTCGAIPEIVDKTSGILVEPSNVEALYIAMRRLSEDEDLYKRLCKGAAVKAHEFDSAMWTNRFVEYCGELVEKPSIA